MVLLTKCMGIVVIVIVICRYRSVDQWWQKNSHMQCWYQWSISSWDMDYTDLTSSVAAQGVLLVHLVSPPSFSLQRAWGSNSNLSRPGLNPSSPVHNDNLICVLYWKEKTLFLSFIVCLVATLEGSGRVDIYIWGVVYRKLKFFYGHM